MTERKKKLVFISKGNAHFVQNDKTSLALHYEISCFEFPDQKGLAYIIPLLRFIFFSIRNIPGSSCCYMWFADYHTIISTFICKLFSVKSILIIGGYDAAKLPEYSYGAHRSLLRSKCIDFSCKLSTEVVVVSQFVRKNLNKNTSGRFETTLIYNALEQDGTVDVSGFERKYVCTVCPGEKIYRYSIKGLDIFLQAAKLLPDIPFLIIGPKGDLLQKILEVKPQNVKVIPHLSHEKFLETLKKVKIICQFSRYESFGMSLLEGMQLGAMPMCADDIGTSEIVPPKNQYLVNILEIEKLALKIRSNFHQELNPQSFRDYVNERFSQKKRIERILRLIEK